MKKVLVYGSGKSGVGAANLIAKMGMTPVLYDEKEGLVPEDLLKKLEDPSKAEAVVGTLSEDVLKSIDEVVMSPGVPCDIPNVLTFKEMGIPVIGEVELAYRAGRGRVLAITGTNGKTTTTSLVGEIMKAYVPEVFVVGNIGNPYTKEAQKTTDQSTVVAEISSFQLETIDTFRPAVSAILNITEDHLNRHHTMEEYIRVKELITKNQTKEDVCVLNYEDEVLRAFAEKCPADVFFFSSKRPLENGIFLDGDTIVVTRGGIHTDLLNVNDLLLLGTHNFENVMAAAAICYSAGVPLETIAEAAKKFHPVEHRIEYVATKHGVVWYNDSKGTNPDAAIKGIEAMKWPTFLIAGGYDKKSDYHEWIRSFGGRVKCLVLEGKTKNDIAACAVECGFPKEKIVIKENMHEAMDYCRDHAEEGDAVLLSPACASWGEFPNYEVRGEVFKEYVEKEII
ncbi:MAG: UDP-N-acetylmuramoyl-L-alanine--D-glutamate ligase [Lachnospiraceae bacterium]|nr:UDP-N-acetylmuramoyl-L-alanine--D-glutamate ligase [Lachnospiraceae bacterium]